MNKVSPHSKVSRSVEVLPVPVRKTAPLRHEGEIYVPKLEAREFVQDLVWLLEILARLVGHFCLPSVTPAGLTIDEIEARPRVRKGDTETVSVRVSNPDVNQQAGDIVLTDVTDNLLIGRQTITIPPTTSQVVKFNWETKRARLGEHDLDAEVQPAGGSLISPQVRRVRQVVST